MHDFEAVTGLQASAYVFGAGHNRSVLLDGHRPTEPEVRQEFRNCKVVWDDLNFAVDGQLHDEGPWGQ
jgi:hypothetical protein